MTNDFLHQPRWLYIGGDDAQIHGPFPSIEMNNWLGGNFFQSNLMLKLVEDKEFYPLEQLVNACENENPFSLPGTSFQAVVSNHISHMSIIHHQQRVHSVPTSGGYPSLPATPSSTPTPGPVFGGCGGNESAQFQHQNHPQHQQQPSGPPVGPLLTFPVQFVRTSMGGPPLPPAQFLMMPPPLPPPLPPPIGIGPNNPQMAPPPLPTALFRPGPQPPMYSPPIQQQQSQPPIPVPISGFLPGAAFNHQFVQQSTTQTNGPITNNIGGGLLPSFPPPPPFSMPETRFPPPTLLQLQHHQNHQPQQQNGGGADKKEEENGDGAAQNHQQQQKEEKEETGTATMMGMEASDSPDSGHVVTPCAQPDKSVDTDDAPWNLRQRPLMVDRAVGPDSAFEASTHAVGAQTDMHMISTEDAQKWISQLFGFPIVIVEANKVLKTMNKNHTYG